MLIRLDSLYMADWEMTDNYELRNCGRGRGPFGANYIREEVWEEPRPASICRVDWDSNPGLVKYDKAKKFYT
jgi:hypothetical protein